MIRALARRLLRHYPLAWRERYEGEVCALIDESSLRFRDLAELVRGLLTERARELVSSDDRPRRTLLVLSLMKPIMALLFVGLAATTGLGVRQLTGPWSEQAQGVGAGSVVLFVIVFLTVLLRARVRPGFGSTQPPYPAWVGMALLPWLFLEFTVVFASGLSGPSSSGGGSEVDGLMAYARWWNWWVYAFVAADLSSSLWPTHRLLSAFSAVSVLEGRVKGAQQWVDGCHEMIGKGVPSPLDDAEAHVALVKQELEDARAHLHSLGYRARFRQDLTGRVSA